MQTIRPLLRLLTAFPLDSAEAMLNLHDKGKLDIQNGLVEVIYEEDTHNFQASFTDGSARKFDIVLNACGFSYDLKSSKFKLYSNLAESKFVDFNLLGSLEIDLDT